MLRKLSLFIFFTVAVSAAQAQNASHTTGKNTEKQSGVEIDYKQVGAPLPPVRIVVYKDTAKKDTKLTAPSEDANAGSRRRRRKKQQMALMSAHEEGILTNADLDNGANLFLMVFNPTCSHCQDETIMLGNNMSLFKKSRLVLMATPVTQPYIGDFLFFAHVREHPEITVGVDSAGLLDKIFLYQSLPQINIYDKNRKLLKIFSGEVVIDSLKPYIE